MSNMRDGPVLKAVAEVVKDHVGKAFAVLRGEINEVKHTVANLPRPQVGEKGEKGDIGPAGRDGERGQDGLNGRDGVDGKDGADGRDGKDGEAGRDGAKGLDGKDGIDGKDAPPVDLDAVTAVTFEKVKALIPEPVHGKDGKDGPAGKDGKDGINGKDAEPVDIEALSASITQKVLAQIPPPKQGEPGRDGTSVHLETVRGLIASEVSKAMGDIPKPVAGRDGRDGRVGDPGRDALDIDILPAIDESMSYQRGIFARHRNGLFRAYRTTDPVQNNDYEAAGWMCIVAGVCNEVSSLATDQRTVIRSLEFSDGKLITSEFTTPTIIDRGTWKSGVDYFQGDAVTMAGSLWICQAKTQDRPGISNAWRLAVKRGSDGKDLRT